MLFLDTCDFRASPLTPLCPLYHHQTMRKMLAFNKNTDFVLHTNIRNDPDIVMVCLDVMTPRKAHTFLGYGEVVFF